MLHVGLHWLRLHGAEFFVDDCSFSFTSIVLETASWLWIAGFVFKLLSVAVVSGIGNGSCSGADI